MEAAAMNWSESNAQRVEAGGRVKFYEENATGSDCTWGTFIHLASFAGVIFPTGGSVLAPLILWLIKRDESPFLDDHGREAVNFQISMLIYYVVAAISCIGWPLLMVIPIVQIVAPIVMAVRANHGEYIRYPVTIRFLK